MDESLLLKEYDFERAATRLQCEVAAIKAVTEVESQGRGFLPDGRVKILFERHVFSRLTDHKYDDSHPHISGPRGGYKGGDAEWPRIEEALLLDKDAALKSASWGLFQCMGFNCGLCGFVNVEDFVTAMAESEGRQLDLFVTFVQIGRLDKLLRARDWTNFARKYNGPSFAVNQYDVRLERAFHHFSVNT